MPKVGLRILPHRLTIHRLPASAGIPQPLFSADFYALTRTENEISIIAPSEVDIPSDKKDSDWVCLKVEGPLDLACIGILSGIADVLKAVNVSIFVTSTFDTDYILVKADKREAATIALKSAGYAVR